MPISRPITPTNRDSSLWCCANASRIITRSVIINRWSLQRTWPNSSGKTSIFVVVCVAPTIIANSSPYFYPEAFFVQLQSLDLFQFQPEALEETCLVQTYRRTNSVLHIYANGEHENIFSISFGTSVKIRQKEAARRSLISFIYRCNTRAIQFKYCYFVSTLVCSSHRKRRQFKYIFAWVPWKLSSYCPEQ